MSKGKPRRVNYRVNYCSSEDGEHPVSELVLQSADSKGWQSKRFAPFPQTIIIELLDTTMVESISFLSHENKICTRIEIEGKEEQEDNWIRLGYTTLQSGLNTNYQSRELRKVSAGNRTLRLLKFVFNQNYANPINIFNQVGLIALLVYGYKASEEKEMVRSKQGQIVAHYHQVDRQTILKLKNLEILKREAAECLNFQDAKQYKKDIDDLKEHLQALIILERDKKAAVKRDDFDQARLIAERMRKIRGPMVMAPRSARSSNSFSDNQSMRSPKPSPPKSPVRQNDDPHYRLPPRRPKKLINQSFDLNPQPKASLNFDQVRIHSNGQYPIQQALSRQITVDSPNRSRMRQQQSTASLPKLSRVDKLNPRQVEQYGRYFPIFNEVTFEYLLSKEHAHRQRGISTMLEVLDESEFDNKRSAQQFVAASIYIVRKLITDKIISVVIAIVDYFGLMMKKLRPASQNKIAGNVQFILEKLCEYLGHNNDKLSEQCEDVMASLPVHPLTPLDLIFRVLTAPKNDRFPRITQGKLKMIARLIGKNGLGKSQNAIIDFAEELLDDKNNDIRTAAIDVCVEVSLQIGYQKLHPRIQRHKPQTLRAIQQKVQGQGGAINIGPLSGSISEQPPNNAEYYCDYCQKYDKRFEDENFRNKHLYSECPMIAFCKHCKQAVQAMSFNNHLLSECPNHKFYKRCPRCKEAIPTSEYNTHTKNKECIPAKAPAQAGRCPFCHEDTQPGEKGFRKHLVDQKCPNNPRS